MNILFVYIDETSHFSVIFFSFWLNFKKKSEICNVVSMSNIQIIIIEMTSLINQTY